jgi:hypothetical protein
VALNSSENMDRDLYFFVDPTCDHITPSIADCNHSTTSLPCSLPGLPLRCGGGQRPARRRAAASIPPPTPAASSVVWCSPPSCSPRTPPRRGPTTARPAAPPRILAPGNKIARIFTHHHPPVSWLPVVGAIGDWGGALEESRLEAESSGSPAVHASHALAVAGY